MLSTVQLYQVNKSEQKVGEKESLLSFAGFPCISVRFPSLQEFALGKHVL